MTQKPSTSLLVALVAGALLAGCGGGANTPSTTQTIQAVGTTTLVRTTPTTSTARKAARRRARRARENPQVALERLHRECAQQGKPAPKLSAAQNQTICKELKLIP